MANGLVRGSRLVRWVRSIGCVNGLIVFVDLVVNEPFLIATMKILFSHKFFRCDISILPQKRASRNSKDCLPLEK
jgi:hypothetical protein